MRIASSSNGQNHTLYTLNAKKEKRTIENSDRKQTLATFNTKDMPNEISPWE